MAARNVHLTTDVVPRKYEIHLKPDLEAFVFEGKETIRLTLKKPTSRITLHSVELDIESAEASFAGGNVFAGKISYNEKSETATLSFGQTLPRGPARLTLVFRGVLNDKMHGFYRSGYETSGKKRYLATTQFESTDARRAFPCFDEPAMKAVFEVSLTAPKGHEAISNTLPIEIRAHAGGYKTFRFAPTPLMSTYLAVFIVGELEHVETRTKDGVLVRVFTTPGKKRQARFALSCAAKILSFFNSYFGIPYPLPALDLIAIPDFSAGAMENWGAVTYRESALLVDPAHSSAMTRQRVAIVIAHELAHQWFGNLVTMSWWTHLWLNEGFASYISYLAVDHLFPKWEMWTQFLHEDSGRALEYDALEHTHPIEVDVHHPAEIAEVFDAVSYSKGASVIRMLADYLGEKYFREGLRRYLRRHRYGNAATEDLWRALERASGKQVGAMMRNWTGKPGYPLVEVSKRAGDYRLRQRRFFASPRSRALTRDKTLWHVPIRGKFGSGKEAVSLLMRTPSARLPAPRAASLLKLNAGETGFYRTRYSKALRAGLQKAVREKRLPVADRLGLARDAFALSEAGELTTKEALEFAAEYAKETEYAVWTEVSWGLAKVRSLVAREPFLEAYDEFARSIFSDIGRKMKWDETPKSHSHALLRVLAFDNLARFGDEKTIARAKELFRTVRRDTNPIPPDMRGVVYAGVARYGGKAEHEKLIKLYKVSALHEEKNRIGRALGLFKQRPLLRKTLAFALSSHVRRQDSVRLITVIATNPRGRELAWAFVKARWQFFLKAYGGSRELAYLIEPFSSSADIALAKDIEAFFKAHPCPEAKRTLQQIGERIRANALWLSRDGHELATFLSEKSPATDGSRTKVN